MGRVDLNKVQQCTKGFSWFLLAFFFMDSWWLLDAIWVYLKGHPQSAWLQFIFFAVAIFLGMMVVIIYFKEAFQVRIKALQAAFIILCGLFLNAGAVFLVNIWGLWVPAAVLNGNLNQYLAAVLFVFLILVLVTFALFLIFFVLLLMTYEIPLNKTGKLFICLSKEILKHFGRFMRWILVTLAVLIFLISLVKITQTYLISKLPIGFWERYFLTLLIAAVKAAILLIFLFEVKTFVSDDDSWLVKMKEEGGRGSFLFPLFFFLLCITLTFIPLTQSKNGVEELIFHLQSRIIQADQLRISGNPLAANFEYTKAKADALALKGLIIGIDCLREGRDISDAQQFLTDAEEMYAQSPYIQYFRGLLAKETSEIKEADPGANKFFAAAARYLEVIPEANIWTLNGYKAQDEQLRRRDALNLLINKGVFRDRFYSALKMNKQQLEKINADLVKIQKDLEERTLYMILEKCGYTDFIAVLNEINLYAQQSPTPEVFYQMALLAEKIPYPDQMYDYARQYYTASKDEKDKDRQIADTLFTSYMYVRSGHAKEAVVLMEPLYQKYPEHLDIACDYAYALLENKEPTQAIAVIDGIPGEKTSFQLFISAIAYLELEQGEKAFEAMTGICQQLCSPNLEPGDFEKLEEYVYQFILEYDSVGKNRMSAGVAILETIEKTKTPELLYQLIMGFEAWRAGNYEVSNSYYRKALDINDRLTYPYYLQGINFNEMAGHLKQDTYDEAEKCLLTFIQRRPKVTEAYFLLGFVYKHSGDQLRAERAFNYVLLANPHRDNPVTEQYSMFNHARLEVEEK